MDRAVSKTKKRIFEILEAVREGDKASRIFDIFIVGLILLNLMAVILETVKALSVRHGSLFRNLEIFSVAIFTVEYVLRIWTCTANERFKRPLLGRMRFALTPLPTIDLLAILPFYLPMFIPFDLRFLRVLRLFRIFRMFKIARYSRALGILGSVLKSKKEELIIAVFIIMVLLILASSLMYFVESKAQPALFSNIPQAMWWGIATLTTVGYGDVYPVTSIGKFLGAIVSLLGIGMFALPTGIISSGFAEEIRARHDAVRIICPHCGKSIQT